MSDGKHITINGRIPVFIDPIQQIKELQQKINYIKQLIEENQISEEEAITLLTEINQQIDNTMSDGKNSSSTFFRS